MYIRAQKRQNKTLKHEILSINFSLPGRSIKTVCLGTVPTCKLYIWKRSAICHNNMNKKGSNVIFRLLSRQKWNSTKNSKTTKKSTMQKGG